MKAAPPALLPLLRSPTQGDLLALLYLHPEQAFSLTDLAKRLGVSLPTVMREADRLTAAGLLAEERIGNTRRIRAATDTLLYRPLTDLLAVTYGPLPVLTDLLKDVDGIREAYIYGSWAARYQGESGPPPADVDVLVVGTADPDDLFVRAEQARARLGRDVMIHQITPRAWRRADSNDPFLTSVRERPLVRLEFEEHA